MQGKVEAYNKVVKSEFIELEDKQDTDDDKLSKICFVKRIMKPGNMETFVFLLS
jgi:hypothetical protein